MKYDDNNDVVRPFKKEVDESKDEEKAQEVEFKDEKGSFGISPKEINEIIKKYDFRNFIEEIQEIDRLGGMKVLEEKFKTSSERGISNDPAEKKERVDIYGDNVEEIEEVPNCCVYVLEALEDVMLQILLIAAVVQIALGASPLAAHPEKEWIEGMSIIIAVLVVVSVGSITNYSKEKKFKELNEKNADMIKITIKRDGEILGDSSPNDILVGDIIKINTGTIVPADGILVSSEGQIKIEESSLTGESDLIEKEPFDVCLERAKEFEGKDTNKHSVPSPLIFSGTLVKEGNGWFLAWAVGNLSKKGQIKVQVQQNLENEDSKTPLESKLDEIASDIGWFGIISSIFTLVALMIRFGVTYSDKKKAYDEFQNNPIEGQVITDPKKSISGDILNILLLCIAIIVVAIPEGLPLAVTLSLAFSINKMMEHQNLVRKMHACETMGGANYVCSDKTGTLTANIMNIFRLFDGKKVHDTKEVTKSEEARADPLTYFTAEYYDALKVAISVNLQMNIDRDEKISDPSKTDLAFANILHNFSTNIYPIQSKYNVNTHDIKRIAFSSKRKKMTTIVKSEDFPTGYRAYMKGASEIVMKSVTNIINPQDMTTKIKSDEEDTQIEAIIKDFANDTLRTICIAYKDITDVESQHYLETDDSNRFIVENTGFTMICIAGIKDTLRDGVTEAVQQCHTAGITVVMVTGDLKETAVAISKECKIWNLPPNTPVPENYSMTGEEFYKKIEGLECEICNKSVGDCKCPKTKKEAKERGKDEEVQKQKVKNMEVFETIIKDLRVLARSRPDDKYALVLGLRRLEHVVAVTGDGTNDAQALSKSDVGFAMGREGTDIAKDAADIIILDDNFASIISAVTWGRNIYDCIRKFIQFQLTVNITACLLVFICACIGNETPISAIQMLWLNMIMDSLGSLALATEQPHEDILKRKPNSRKEYIINYLMWKHIIGHSIVLIIIILIMYLKSPDFLLEDDKTRIAEAVLVHSCYGKWPGRGPNSNGDYYIMSGSILEWVADQYLIVGKTKVECGYYSENIDMTTALDTYKNAYGNTAQMTIIFNIFVIYTLFNQINARVINDDFNILYHIEKNLYFICLIFIEMGLQAILIQFCGDFFSTSKGGLTGRQWGYCFGFSSIAFITGIILKIIKFEVLIEKAANLMKNFSRKNKIESSDSENRLKDNLAENEYRSNHMFQSNNLEKPMEKKLSKEHSGSRRKSLVESMRNVSGEHHKNLSKMRYNKDN